MRHRSQNAGFTLIELVVYLFIFSIVVSMVFWTTKTMRLARVKSDVTHIVEEEGAQAMIQITQLVRNAQTINSPLLGLSASTLSITSYSGATGTFSVSGGMIVYTQGSASYPLTSTKTVPSSLTFSNLGYTGTNGSMKISFTLSATNGTVTYSRTFVDSATVRRK